MYLFSYDAINDMTLYCIVCLVFVLRFLSSYNHYILLYCSSFPHLFLIFLLLLSSWTYHFKNIFKIFNIRNGERYYNNNIWLSLFIHLQSFVSTFLFILWIIKGVNIFYNVLIYSFLDIGTIITSSIIRNSEIYIYTIFHAYDVYNIYDIYWKGLLFLRPLKPPPLLQMH